MATGLLIDSDNPLDKVILLKSDTLVFSVSGTSYTFNHGLSFTPLIKVVWSTNSDFSVTYSVGDGPVSSSVFSPFIPMLSMAKANSTSVTLEFSNPDTVPTAYLRVYGFMPSNVNVDASFTSSSAENFTIDSDYNYTKLYMSGVTASSSTGSSTESINHNLGYYPQVESWYEQSGYIWVLNSASIFNGVEYYSSANITTSTLTYIREQFPSSAIAFHYRIYEDELA